MERPDVAERNHQQRGEKNPMFGEHHSKETREKMSKARGEKSKGINNPMYGKDAWNKGLTKEVDERIKNHSEKMKDENNPNFNKSPSEETREKMSRVKKGIFCGMNHPNYGVRHWGEENPNWKGGTSFEPYDSGFNNKLKEKIRGKFNYTCVLCEKFAKIPHHIDYNKNNNIEENFVLLCSSCNTKVNANRQFWETNFKILNGVFDPSFFACGELWI